MPQRNDPSPSENGTLEERIGYRFVDRALLTQALTHRSFAREGRSQPISDNERLEFVGDAVLAMTTGALLYARFPEAPEGVLTQLRADLVNAPSLARIARGLELGHHLRFGRSILKGGGADSDNILSDAFEALLGAVFIDGGFDRALAVVDALFAGALAEVAHHPGRQDYKTKLQELLQKQRQLRPEYLAVADGPVHQCHYAVEVVWDGRVHGRGEGSSKKRAEQEAARQALAGLREHNP